jgi:hypothetical protein
MILIDLLDLHPAAATARFDHTSQQQQEISKKPSTVNEWLRMIHLSQYSATFQKCGYTNLQLVRVPLEGYSSSAFML